MMEERPAALKRNRPVPAPDENVDPVSAMMERKPVQEPAPEPEAAPEPPKKKQREIVFNFSTRLSQTAYDTLYTAVDQNGLSVREATEQAIMAYWGKQ